MNLESAEISMRADGTEVMTLRIALPREIRSALDFEQEGQRVLNGWGRALMEYGLGRFDTEGEQLRIGRRMFTSKGRQPER